MTDELYHLLVPAVREHEELQNEAADLASWLPHMTIAKLFHGDYAFEFTGSPAFVMGEACSLISRFRDPKASAQWPSYDCPCGEGCEMVADLSTDAPRRLKEAYSHGVCASEVNPEWPLYGEEWVAYHVGWHRGKAVEE